MKIITIHKVVEIGSVNQLVAVKVESFMQVSSNSSLYKDVKPKIGVCQCFLKAREPENN